jgi:hypothetical protein
VPKVPPLPDLGICAFPRTGVAVGVMSEPIPPEGIARYVVAQAAVSIRRDPDDVLFPTGGDDVSADRG